MGSDTDLEIMQHTIETFLANQNMDIADRLKLAREKQTYEVQAKDQKLQEKIKALTT